MDDGCKHNLKPKCRFGYVAFYDCLAVYLLLQNYHIVSHILQIVLLDTL